MSTRDDRARAKAIICEIIWQAGGTLRNKTNLYKAFWHAHVEHAKTHVQRLSHWPIVKMPNGPGIDKFDELLGELMADGAVECDQVSSGNFTAFEFRLVGTGQVYEFSEGECDAIKAGANYVKNKSASAVSEASHVASRAWNSASDGDIIDVFLDVMDEDELQLLMAEIESTNQIVGQAFEKVYGNSQCRSTQSS